MLDYKKIKEKKILVTGGAGFIGSNLCEYLLDLGADVTCLDNFSTGYKNNIKVTPIPGVSSIVTAMSASGFNDQFLFYGFLPKTENEINKVLVNLSNNNYSQVFFITSNKINFYIKKFKEFFSGREIFIAKEMTKVHETFFRGKIDDFEVFKNSMKGELTVIISEKKKEAKSLNKKEIINKAKKYLKKYTLKDTVDLIFESEKINRKEIYKLCLYAKNKANT